MASAEWTEATTLGEYQAAINQRVSDLLGSYTSTIAALPVRKRASKEFNDAVWGTVTLSAVEVMVLDSPLLQRLRRIRQLGVAHYVYPGTNHTRIEHSIGVCHQVSRVVESALDHAREMGYSNEIDVLADMLPTLRLAGLCHDVGHGLFSHVSENALALNARLRSLRNDFAQAYDLSKSPQLSEMAAYFMIASPAFASLLGAVLTANKLPPDPQLPAQIANIIAGRSVSDRMPLLHELISGPFDADKMDYMKRDALMCGIPVVTDIERLVQKTRAVAKNVHDLPATLKQGVKVTNEPYILLGVARSGSRAIDELALGRTLMFDKVYRHHKVRAVEAMVASIVECAGPALSVSPELLPLDINDEDFLSLTAQAFEDRAKRNGCAGWDVAAAADLVRRLRERDLFIRAIAFSQRSPFDALADSDERRLHHSRFISAVSKLEGHTLFLDRLAAEVENIAAVIGRSADVDALTGGRARPYLWVDPPRSDSAGQVAPEGYAHLISDDREVIEVSRANADLRGWTDAYTNTRDIGFVFAPRSIADITYVAAELVMRRDYHVWVPDQMKHFAKTDSDAVHSIKIALDKHDYYTGTLRALGPDPDVMLMANFKDRIAAILTKFQGYQGPAIRDESERAVGDPSPFDQAAVVEWIKQFPRHLVPLALKTVESVRMISRSDAKSAVETYMTDHSMSRAVVAPLGDPKDGASLIAYFAGDAFDPSRVRVESVKESVAAEEPLIIIDDFIGLGNSSISILDTLMGEPPTTDLNETRVNVLNKAAQQAFRKREIHFLFLYGFDEGRANLQKRIKQLRLRNATVAVVHGGDEIPTVATALEGEPLLQEFIDENYRVGAQLMASAEPEKADSRRFGYGNKGVLLISSFNTPTVTMTSLWRRSMVDGNLWSALFPRRAKR